MTPITQFLSERLSEIEDEALIAVAVIAGVDAGVARRARAGESIASANFFPLIAALGFDPMTQERRPSERRGKFNTMTLSLFLNSYMRKHKLPLRTVSRLSGLSVSAVNAICECRPVSPNNVVKACAYLNIHPFEQCERVREAA